LNCHAVAFCAKRVIRYFTCSRAPGAGLVPVYVKVGYDEAQIFSIL
jgi:hypothetical protein